MSLMAAGTVAKILRHHHHDFVAGPVTGIVIGRVIALHRVTDTVEAIAGAEAHQENGAGGRTMDQKAVRLCLTACLRT